MSAEDRPHIEARTIADLHDWLADNHASAGSTWLITYKKAHADYLPWGSVVEELLCWGWIDSSMRSVDAMRQKHLISPRKDTSAWSAVNKAIVAAMREAGRMQPAGEARIRGAKGNGMWTFLDDVERLEVPADLADALGNARPTWEGWTRSQKRTWLEQIKRARTDPTRQKRIAACAEAARTNATGAGLS